MALQPALKMFNDSIIYLYFCFLWVAIYLPKISYKWLPMIVMGSSAICGGLLSLLLPETLGTQLPETLEDTENFKKNDKGFFQCWSSAKLKARTDDPNFGKSIDTTETF